MQEVEAVKRIERVYITHLGTRVGWGEHVTRTQGKAQLNPNYSTTNSKAKHASILVWRGLYKSQASHNGVGAACHRAAH